MAKLHTRGIEIASNLFATIPITVKTIRSSRYCTSIVPNNERNQFAEDAKTQYPLKALYVLQNMSNIHSSPLIIFLDRWEGSPFERRHERRLRHPGAPSETVMFAPASVLLKITLLALEFVTITPAKPPSLWQINIACSNSIELIEVKPPPRLNPKNLPTSRAARRFSK
jgi:hypothetical protein